MTRQTVMDKDRLAAFVDGELPPEESAAVVMHLADHPEDQAYVDDVMAANAALARAFAAPMQEPVPPALRDLVMGTAPAAPQEAMVLPFRTRPRNRAAIASWGGLVAGAALAAGLAVAVYLPGADALELVPGPLAAASPLVEVLTSRPSGAVEIIGGAEAMVLASVATPDGFCREIEVSDAEQGWLKAALVCTTGAGWTVEAVMAETYADAAGAEGFGTASGAEAMSFEPILDRIGAGAFLGPDEEAAAIARAWAR